MNISDLVLVGAGGGGNKLVDTIVNYDPRFISYFFNTSKTDIQSLDNYDPIAVNYFCISNQQNGMGRDRNLGKHFAKKSGWNMIEKINNFDQKTIFIFTSLGGGSGSSITSTLLAGIQQLKLDDNFDKTVNLVCILPSLDSSDDILKNTIDTWNEIMSYDCVTNMIFIDNNNLIDGKYLDEEDINENFAELFSSIFDIPNSNGRNFDNGNLGKIINSKGCTYIYKLDDNYETTLQALKHADENSVIAKMYNTDDIVDTDNTGKKRLLCSYVGTSFNSESYLHEDILNEYKPIQGEFTGYNEENNLILLSGCLPPLYSIGLINIELDDRAKQKSNINTSFNNFVVSNNSNNSNVNNVKKQNNTQKESKPKNNMKKMMKKDIFNIH